MFGGHMMTGDLGTGEQIARQEGPVNVPGAKDDFIQGPGITEAVCQQGKGRLFGKRFVEDPHKLHELFESRVVVVYRSGQVDDAAVNSRFVHQVLPVKVSDGGRVIAMHIIPGDAHDTAIV